MKIYLCEYEDYDGYGTRGYFTDEEKAEECCKYLNKTEPSSYIEDAWEVFEYELDDTDYATLNERIYEVEVMKAKAELEKERRKELAELARLKAKYETNNEEE